PDLSEFLEEVALVADIDNLDESNDRVVLMTLHSAKGLEFPIVYMTGLEDGLFPSYMSTISDDMSDLEEERRLFYVGVTRAKLKLHITAAKVRMTRGEAQFSKPSRFIGEMPDELLIMRGARKKVTNPPVTEPHPRVAPRTKPFAGTSMADIKTGAQLAAGASGSQPEYGVGDRVRHVKFGDGTVLDIRDGGRDYEVTVEFDEAGTKKMFASFAKLKKL
ncbi:MAG: 3'-5' exonuclease, partial [Lachnospiraceae bacterium]